MPLMCLKCVDLLLSVLHVSPLIPFHLILLIRMIISEADTVPATQYSNSNERIWEQGAEKKWPLTEAS